MSDDKIEPTLFKYFVRGYNAGWRDALTAIRHELLKPDQPDGFFDHKLDQLEREHPHFLYPDVRGP
jgi:hypothetical protein